MPNNKCVPLVTCHSMIAAQIEVARGQMTI